MSAGSSKMDKSDVDELETITKKKLVVTTIETKDGKVDKIFLVLVLLITFIFQVISETEDVRELNG